MNFTFYTGFRIKGSFFFFFIKILSAKNYDTMIVKIRRNDQAHIPITHERLFELKILATRWPELNLRKKNTMKKEILNLTQSL